MLVRLLVPIIAKVFVLLVVSILHVPGAAAADVVYPPGLRIGLQPPGDFIVSTRVPGFEDPDRSAIITILDLPARAYDDLARSAFAPDQKGVTDLKRESFPFESGIGTLITGTANEGGGPVHKWFLLAQSLGASNVRDLTTLVQVQVPDAAMSVYTDAVIRKALATVTFRPTPVSEQLGLLPFKLNEMAGFRVMQVLPAGGVILTEGPNDDITTQPYIIIAVGPGAPQDTSERGRFANDLLSTAPLANVRLQLSEPQRISGGPGHEIRAQATGPRGDAVSLVQWVRFGGSGFLRIIGVSAQKDWDAMFTRFRAVRDGVDPR